MFDDYGDCANRLSNRNSPYIGEHYFTRNSKNSEKTEMYHPRQRLFVFSVIIGFFALLALWLAFPWKTVVVEPGYLGVYNDKPYIFGKNGVRRGEVMQPGREWVWKSTEIISVISVPYKQEQRIDDFSTKDNYLVDFDSSISLRIIDAPGIVSDWRLTFWSETLRAEYNSIVRREVSKYSLYELMSSVEKLAELDNSITEKMRAYVASIKIPVVIENVALGRAKPTAEVQAQINETARQNEASQTNIKKAAAETQRKNAEENRAAADMAYAAKMQISPAQFTALRIAEMQTQACMKAASCVIGIERVTPAGK